MDSSDLETEMKADDSSMMIPSKRDIFLSTYRHQNFSLPDSIMHYIAKNPKNTKVYQKMVKRCKYFFLKNPILVLSYLSYIKNGWITYVNETWKSIDINRISAKLWITDRLSVFRQHVSNNSLVSSIIPKIYQCDAKYLILCDQVISLNEFMILCSSGENLDLHRVTVKNDDGIVVSFEKLFEQLPGLKLINYTFTTPSNNTSKNTFEKFWKISHLLNYDSFILHHVPEDFDIDSFHTYMKKNQNTRVHLEFSDQISEEYVTRLEAIVDEVVEAKNHEYKIPYMLFRGLNSEKFNKLRSLYRQ